MSGHVRHGIPTAFDADAARFREIAGSAIIVAKSSEHMREMLSVKPDGYGLATDPSVDGYSNGEDK